MSVHPQAQAVLDCLASKNFPPTHTLSLAEVRAAHLKRRTCYGDMTGDPVAEVTDEAVTTAGGPVPIRIYRPSGQPQAIIAFFHGGGFVNGSITTHDYICRAITNAASATVISLDYRRPPEAPFPAAVHDCFEITNWAAEHQNEYAAAGAPLIVAGDSAGGNLAASVSLMSRDHEGPEIQGQILLYPVLDGTTFDRPSYRDNADGYLLTRAAMIWLWDQYVPDPSARSNPYASPLQAHDHTRLPAALIITAEHDPLRDEGERYASALLQAGVPVLGQRFLGMIHGFMEMPVVSHARHAALDAITRFATDLAAEAAARR